MAQVLRYIASDTDGALLDEIAYDLTDVDETLRNPDFPYETGLLELPGSQPNRGTDTETPSKPWDR